jgi:hypothetical protein
MVVLHIKGMKPGVHDTTCGDVVRRTTRIRAMAMLTTAAPEINRRATG